ncbi:putative RNA-binding protein [Vanrija pseudolonga]|uniref:Purtative RNA-binding protein n=1 Tax=Vanrija pseudolonga TaxID=143232 RepID=A0AAF0Y487_9TREE|nr:purtative RNA-binding protein [Vanrija pseudolonga]
MWLSKDLCGGCIVAAFKQKAKAKGLPEPEDVPEADLEGGEGGEGEGADDEPAVATASTSTKRKRGDEDDTAETKKKDSRAKGKGKKTAWDEDEEGEGDKRKSKKEIKQRFILFVGNLGFKTTADEVRAHFKEAAGRIPSVRLLTDKASGKSRGIAFVELATGTEMQACLRLHETKLNQRAINVELTAGGGGKSAARKGKIEERNKRMGGQRERRAEREKEAGGGDAGAEGEATEAGAGAETGAPEDAGGDANGEFKMRNGRRVRVKPKDDSRPAKRARGDDGGRGGFGGGRGGGRGGFSRPKWTPTGANALAVGQ